MKYIRDTASWISLYLVATCFFLAANAIVLTQIFNANNIKQTLRHENTYSQVVPSVLSTARSSNLSTAGPLPLNETWVGEAANKAFPPQDLEQKGGVVIDSVFNWLDGKTAQPQFSLDFSKNKQQLGAETGSYLSQRLKSLPRCSLKDIPDSVDPYTITCLPPGVNPDLAARSAAANIADNDNFLRDPVISSDNLALDNLGNTIGSSNNPFQGLESARWWYQHKGLLLWLLPLLTVALAVGGILLATDRISALGRLARSFVSSAISLVILVLLIGFGFERLVKLAAHDAVSQDVLSPVFISLAHQARTIYLLFTVIAAVLAIGLFSVKRKLGN